MLDVTKTRTSPRWFDADGHKLTCFLGCTDCQGQCLLKSRSVRDDMISGKYNHCGRMIARCHPTSSERDCRSGIAFGRLRDNIFLRKTGQQFANCRFLFSVCQNQNTFMRNKAFKSRNGFLKKRFVRDKAKELLRPGPAT